MVKRNFNRQIQGLWPALPAICILAVCTVAYIYYGYETNRIRQQKYDEIAAVANLKVGRISEWRQERLGDIRRSARASFFTEGVRQWFANPQDITLRARLRERLTLEQEEGRYADVLLLNREGKVVLSASPDPHPLSPAAMEVVEKVVSGRMPVLSDLYRCPRGIVHMDGVGPILDPEGRTLAVLVLRTNAQSLLFPLIQAWPTAGETAETLLVRRDGDAVLFLNELRQRTNTALSLREPLTRLDLPAAQAVLGKTGIFEGKDYRGVDVLADLMPVPESSWFMVAKVDSREIFAEARYRGRVILLFAAVFVLLAASLTAYGYRHRQARTYRDLYRSERERRAVEEEFRTTLYSIGDAVITTDKTGLVKQMNPTAERLTGWPEAEARGKPIEEVFRIINEESREVGDNPVRRVLKEGTVIGLANHSLLIGRDGSECPIADSGAPIRDAGGWVDGVVIVFQDQTGDRDAGRALRESEKRYRDLWEKAPVMMVSLDPDARIKFASDLFCSEVGYDRREIIGKTPFEFQTEQSAHYARRVVFPTFMKTGTIRDAPLQLVRRNGDVLDVLLNVTAERDDQGNVAGSRSVFVDVTERNRAERALRESEAKYEDLYENAPDMFASVDPTTGRVIQCNRTLSRVTGYSKEEIMSRPIFEMYHPEGLESAKKAFRDFFKTGEVHNAELQLRCKDGSKLYVILNASSVRDETGKILYSRSGLRDITDRKNAELALQESERKYRAVFNIASVGIDMVGRDGRFLEVNSTLCRFLGYSPEELRLLTILDVTYPEDAGKSLEMHTAMVQGEMEGYRLEKRYLRKDGAVLWADTAVSAIRDAEGRHATTVGVIRDITQHKKSEEVRMRLAAAVEQAAETVQITDRNGIITYVNPAFEKTTGYSRQDVVGKKPSILKSGRHGEDFYKRMWETIAGGEIWTGHLINKTKDGTLFEEDASISPVRDDSGEIVNYVAVKRDVTREVSLQRQLFQAQKMEAIGTLAGGVAHDFNNILQVALGYSELILSDDEFPDHFRDDVRKIHESARRGAELVERLLTFGRKAEFKPRPLNLNHRIIELRKMLERTLPKMIDIQLRLSDNPAAINADPIQIDQILMNLAVNARDAMPDGGILVFETSNFTPDEEYTGSHMEIEPGPHVMLTVTDTGSGMDKDTLEHIFEPFYTTKAVGRGPGLGLAMVHGIVMQHRGHIGCYSEPGEGTAFRICFPALVSEEKGEETIAVKMPRGGSETILLVDDDEVVRSLGSRVLTKAGYTVLTASSGKQALEVYKRLGEGIALVLLDLIMPEMGGRECLKDLLGMNPSVRVVIASGYSPDGPAGDAVSGGAKGYVNKPYDLRKLLDVVRSVLDAP
ncbi:MAG: PAS domain S-box protein [Pseudomonadota bacterium]